MYRPRSNKRAHPPVGFPERAAFQWHYEMCVIENMCALFLASEGGAKRVPWREGPVLVSTDPDAANSPNTNPHPDPAISPTTIPQSPLNPLQEANDHHHRHHQPAGDSQSRKHHYEDSQPASVDDDSDDATFDDGFARALEMRLASMVKAQSEKERVARWIAAGRLCV